MSIKTIDLTPDPRSLQIYGEIDLKGWQAIAELVDNSIDSIIKRGVDTENKKIIEITKPTPSKVYVTPTKAVPSKNKINKKKMSPVPYSKEYMQQKWGGTLKKYTEEKGISKKIVQSKKTKKQKLIQKTDKL